MVAGGYYVITGHWVWNIALASLPYALGPTSVLFGKHIDKLAADREKGIHTLPVILGEKTARYTVLAMIAIQYLAVIYLVIAGYFSPFVLVVLLALYKLPRVYQIYRQPKPLAAPADYPPDTWPLWFSATSFDLNRTYGFLLLIGLILNLFVH